ncbi:uncharacterized protein EHS24_007607 [Apiotrichum porosum]|uniref:Protein kinase domain-containing protein n=1 Tax=Apiotrichum porosum TaxID=105984 RepID=A0A427XUS2_9TREE|nr:uncharacterized protein EHS24_007607 [Apiotrichum porosum]RSH82618.1 hypothetical protein EHS24_007607 [Apiotrichum porosum]
MSNAWIHADPSPFGSTDFGLVVGSLNDSARTAACFDLKPASTSLANEIYDLVRVAPCTISWINRTPSYSSLQTIGSLTEDVAREVELHLHQIVRELHANASDTLWYGNLGNALLFKLVAPNVVEVSDRVPRTGRPVQLHQPFPGVGDTMTMSLPTGLIAAACGSKPPLSLFAPGLRQAWHKLHSVPGIQRRAEPIALPRLPATIRGPHVSKTLDCLVGRRSALELAVEGMDLGPAVLPRAPVVNGAMLPDDEPPLKVTLTRWLHSGRTYDGYAASLTGGTNRAAASARVVAKVAQPAFDMALHRDYEPTGEAPPQRLAPEAAHQAASRVYEEARLLDGELAGLVVTPRFRGLWVGNALGDLSPTAASFATYLVMLVDDAGPSLADLGYTWPSLPSHLRTGIRKLYCTLHAVRVVHGDVDLRHICMTPAGTLSLIDFEGARRVDTADAQEIRDEDTLVESNLSL